jgi:NADPH2:quinone reductase
MKTGSPLPPGIRVVIRELAESPLEGIDDHMAVIPWPAPDPAELGAEEVIIAVRSAGVSWVDLLMTSGQYQHMPRMPYCPGLEYSGVVVGVGANVDSATVAEGDSVFVDCFTVGPRTSGEYQSAAGFCSYAVVPAHAVRPIPKGFNFDEASSFAGNYETAYHALVTRGKLQAGETILIHGASGATGLAAVQIAKHLGATVIATGRTESKLAVVAEQGADHVVCIGGPDGLRFRDKVKALTDGQGVDVVYDGVGGDVSLESLRCVRFGARFLLIGWASTPLVAKGKGGRGAPNVNRLPTNLMLMKGLDVLGCPAVISAQRDPSLREKRIADLNAWVEAGAIRPYVSHVFELEQAKDAFMARWNGEVICSCVVRPPVLETD